MGVQSGERGQELLKPKRKRAPRGPAPAALLKKIEDELWDIAHMDIEETPPEPLVDPPAEEKPSTQLLADGIELAEVACG